MSVGIDESRQQRLLAKLDNLCRRADERRELLLRARCDNSIATHGNGARIYASHREYVLANVDSIRNRRRCIGGCPTWWCRFIATRDQKQRRSQ